MGVPKQILKSERQTSKRLENPRKAKRETEKTKRKPLLN